MAKWQRVRIPIRPQFKPNERKVIAQEIIDYIAKRTREGKDVNDRPWSGKAGRYSKSYIKSLDFKIAGKSKSRVNLTLSREMLNSIKLLNHKKGELLIGFDKGDEKLNGKVEGNRLGTYGNRSPIPGKARDFLGISSKAKKQIEDKYDAKKTDRAIIADRIARIGDLLNGDE